MKGFVKRFGIIAFVAIIGSFVIGCEMEVDNDYELLNGDWERLGSYVVTFNNGNGIFKDLNGGIWLEAKDASQIKIGDQCYRNFTKSAEKKWIGEIRIYNNYSPHETLWWEDCTITLNTNGTTISISTSSTGSFNLIKK